MFPLKKRHILINSKADQFAKSFKDTTEVPIGEHPGSFSYQRKNHIHEGVDLYCESEDEVVAIEYGEVIKIMPFTGEQVGSPWWNETWSILVKHNSFYINYGELTPSNSISVGSILNEGDVLGYIKTVLKKDKGRPMTMLHIEMYDINSPLVEIPIKSWNLGQKKPKYLIDPTECLLNQRKV